MASAWQPKQYARFAAERSQPFHDLAAMVRPIPGGRAVDLGCGTGELTAGLHRQVGAAETIGLDGSDTMLAESAAHAVPGVRFVKGDIASFHVPGAYDLVFSNAALQWVLDHQRLFPRLIESVAAGGQIAVQMPANDDHVSHRLAHAIAAEEPYRTPLGGYVRQVPVMPPEWYAALLDRLGFREQHVRMQVYGHHLPDREGVVEWVKGSLLTDYRNRLPADVYEEFLAEYRRRLIPELAADEPFFYPFKRILIWGRR